MIREVGSAQLVGEVKVGEGAKAFLFNQPDGSQTLSFWSVSPVDTQGTGVVSCEPDFAMRLTIPAPDGTYRISDLCGWQSSAMATNGVLSLDATRYPAYVSGLRGVVADTPARPAGKAGPYAPEGYVSAATVRRTLPRLLPRGVSYPQLAFHDAGAPTGIFPTASAPDTTPTLGREVALYDFGRILAGFLSLRVRAATPETHATLWERLCGEFGPGRAVSRAWQDIPPYNILPGVYLRLELLLRHGRAGQCLDECRIIFGPMASLSGTLWEHLAPGDSMCHGFAATAACLIHGSINALQRHHVPKSRGP